MYLVKKRTAYVFIYKNKMTNTKDSVDGNGPNGGWGSTLEDLLSWRMRSSAHMCMHVACGIDSLWLNKRMQISYAFFFQTQVIIYE